MCTICYYKLKPSRKSASRIAYDDRICIILTASVTYANNSLTLVAYIYSSLNINNWGAYYVCKGSASSKTWLIIDVVLSFTLYINYAKPNVNV